MGKSKDKLIVDGEEHVGFVEVAFINELLGGFVFLGDGCVWGTKRVKGGGDGGAQSGGGVRDGGDVSCGDLLVNVSKLLLELLAGGFVVRKGLGTVEICVAQAIDAGDQAGTALAEIRG